MNIFAKLVNLKNKIKPLFLGKKKTVLLVIILCVLSIFILFYSSKGDKTKSSATKNSESISVEDYSSSIENKLQNMLLKIDEVNSVSVMVAVQANPKIEYLTETEEVIETTEKGSSSTKSTTVVFEKNGSVSTPVVVTTIMPKILGVLVVVNNISASTKVSIINSISVVLNIDTACISILQES